MERQALALLAHVDEVGNGSMLDGTIEAIEAGWFQSEIAEASYQFQRKLNDGRWILVGANGYTEGNDDDGPPTLYIDDAVEARQLKRLAQVKQTRDDNAVRHALARVAADAADPVANLMPAFIDAAAAYATLGEIVTTLQSQFGTWTEPNGA
jgi:methylmalonyl-CoA mutase N-terminal domain/subunit